MRIYVAGSMQFVERKIIIRDQLIAAGHDAFVTFFADPFVGKSDEEKETLKIAQKNNEDAIRVGWQEMQTEDAILVANFDKNGIKNYIGGNAFLEMGFAHILNQQIYLLNPIPDMIYTTEIVAMRPVVIDGDISKIS